jgi:membrane protein YqaA with SNARE-associated domain
MLYKILTVAGLATFEIYAAIPAGFAMSLPSWVIALASIVGGIVGALAATFLGERVKAWVARYRKPKPPKPIPAKPSLAHRIWDKYGIIGLGIIGTSLIGAPLSIAAGVGLNVPLQRLLFWCCIGIVLRCLVLLILGILLCIYYNTGTRMKTDCTDYTDFIAAYSSFNIHRSTFS